MKNQRATVIYFFFLGSSNVPDKQAPSLLCVRWPAGLVRMRDSGFGGARRDLLVIPVWKLSVVLLYMHIIMPAEDYDAIRYPSYRTAAKIRKFQISNFLQFIPLEFVIGVFARHGLSVTENSVTLNETEIEDIVSDIYFATSKEADYGFNIHFATRLIVNQILKAFDAEDRRKVFVLSVKIFLTLLCDGKLDEKYDYLYQFLADHNACLSKTNMHILLFNLCKITEMLGESSAYGSQLIQASIDDCFGESQSRLGISETEFVVWLMQNPPLFAWVAAFHRLKSAENTIHDVQCSTCRTMPVRGLKFSCLKCPRFTQCQICFFLGRVSSNHKLKHPIREYCAKFQVHKKQIAKFIVGGIRKKLRICPPHISSRMKSSSSSSSEFVEDEVATSDRTSVLRISSDPQNELQSIINHLEEENRQLLMEIMGLCGSRAERLQRHRATVESQLQRLKTLKESLFEGESISLHQAVSHVQSTPMLSSMTPKHSSLALPECEVSPIDHQICTGKRDIALVDEYGLQRRFHHSFKINQIGEHLSGACRNTFPSEHAKFGFNTRINRNNINNYIFESGFSQWFEPSDFSIMKDTLLSKLMEDDNFFPTLISRDISTSPNCPKEHSPHKSSRLIENDLNDILNRLQYMITGDFLCNG